MHKIALQLEVQRIMYQVPQQHMSCRRLVHAAQPPFPKATLIKFKISSIFPETEREQQEGG